MIADAARREAKWEALRRRIEGAWPELYPVGPHPNTCVVCRGPVRRGFARCWQCERHAARAGPLLADAVVPVCWAVKGTPFGAALWQYKSRPDPQAATSLAALLLTFLHDHGPCVWRQVGLAAVRLAPVRLAVVPSGCGRPGPHPLLARLAPYLRLPLVPLTARPGGWGRELDPAQFSTERAEEGAPVLLLDDTWVSGASAQSAAMALKLAGAGPVAVVVLGRHLDPGDPVTMPLIAALAPSRYDPARCAAIRQKGHSISGPVSSDY